MSRSLRVDVEGGWYHVSARGTERRSIFPDRSYYLHFLGLLENMSERYGVEVHAYCLMDNHYHLLIRTPNANASAALQWLNVSHSAWFNRKQQRVGHVFQGRFSSKLIEEGAWLLLVSVYIHLNPVRIAALGLNKKVNTAESLGLIQADASMVKRRLKVLREYRWSSFRAYAGYDPTPPAWLTTVVLWRRGGGRTKYREQVQARLTRGEDPSEYESLQGRVAVGSTVFLEYVRSLITQVSGEQPDRTFLERPVALSEIIKIVETEKGVAWSEFCDRRGDLGRSTVYYLARKRSGLTLRQIGEALGGVDYKTVGKAIERFEKRLGADKACAKWVKRCLCIMSTVET